MAHVFIPPVTSGARESDYVPVGQRPRTRDRRSAKGKNAFESNWFGPCSTDVPASGSGEKREKRTKKPEMPPKEEEVVDDDDDDEVEVGEKGKINLPTSLIQALATAFTYNSANPNIAASGSKAQAPTVAGGSTRLLAKKPRAETFSDSGGAEVVISTPTKSVRANRNNNKHSPQAVSLLVYVKWGGNVTIFTHRRP
ncbi:hypothetical protein EI94DRAFT_813712 [Lactarius quietus]|nr:hypothetical protein EI94DRAFT_866730 [Lactarius quietus]KAF8261304.1 hypothetical protein EI94DRAFT_813712 [Lactarius quietus]